MVLIGVIPRDINQVIVFHFFVSSYLQFVIMAGSIHTYLYHPKKKKGEMLTSVFLGLKSNPCMCLYMQCPLLFI